MGKNKERKRQRRLDWRNSGGSSLNRRRQTSGGVSNSGRPVQGLQFGVSGWERWLKAGRRCSGVDDLEKRLAALRNP
ncbi:hypothetical protein AgCh_004612 [Apium graveolens]